MKFKDYTFGFADSETELIRKPDIFKTAFYDPKEILNKLLYENHFILIGNKGVGKTAYSAKIRSISDANEKINASQVTLSNFEFDKFANLSRDEYSGGQKFKQAWDLTVLIEVYKFLNNSLNYTSVDSFYNIINFLKSNNLVKLDSINSTIRNIKNLEINFKDFIKIGTTKNNCTLMDFSISGLIEYFQSSLNDISFNNIKNYLIIDGLDDVLRYEKEKVEILSGLFKSVKQLNDYFFKNNIPIKIIVLAREDILASISDTDFNKMKRDDGILLNWNNSYDLNEIIKLRFLLSGVAKRSINSHWCKIFPPRVNKLSSLSHVLTYTLSKPRDIIQFMEQCKIEFPNEESLSYSQLRFVLEQYSLTYFYEEMKNELSGFIDNDDIDNIVLVFTDIGKTDFSFERFKSVASKHFTDSSDFYLKKVFNILFDNGYIGQISSVPQYSKKQKKDINKTQAIFKHKNPTTKINLNNKFTLHKGLYKACNIE
jgi:hypothetical protein